MKILILGSGGREHAICWKLSHSRHFPQLYMAPGNGGTLELGVNVEIEINDFYSIKEFCLSEEIQMVIVGPEEPLVNGIYDFFKADSDLQHIIITGPSAAGAQLEGSKSFSKKLMEKYGIPTAQYREFNEANFDEGIAYLESHPLPIVLKADGLAAGKGVVICKNVEEAKAEFIEMIRHSKFGSAGRKVVVEQFLDGVELSVFVLTDGKNYVILPEAKDYKKIGIGDTGANTGGMGAISPVPFATHHFLQKVEEGIIKPTLFALQNEDIDYKGFIFFGLIKVNEEPLVIEYNCRLGDPEAEVILIRLKNDLIDLFTAMHNQSLNKMDIEIDERSVATIVGVSGGYPNAYQKGLPIDFEYLKNPEARKYLDEAGGVAVFHAGTKQRDNEIVTNGGRVVAVSAMADTLAESIELAKETLEQIHFKGMYYRNDIGYEFVE